MSGPEQAATRDNADGGPRRVIDTSVAHSARVHNYWLGGVGYKSGHVSDG